MIEATRCSGRNCQQQRAIGGADASHLLGRNTVAGAHQTIEAISTSGRVDVATGRDDGYRLAWIVKAGIKIRHVVRLSKGWRKVIKARAKLEAQPGSYLPTVSRIGLKLVEAEKSDRIVICFIVSTEVP